MLKKILIIAVGLVLVVIAVIAIWAGAIASSVVKDAINSYGPQMTDTKVVVEDVSIQPYIGSGTITGLEVGNPDGWKAADAFTLKRVHVSLVPTSLLSDTIKINTVEIEDPIFVYESTLLNSNISELLNNVKKNTKSTNKEAEQDSQAEGDGAQKRFVIHRLLVTGGTVQVGVLNQSAEVKLPKIEMENFSEEGITAAEATNKILDVVLSKVIFAATELATKAATDPMGTAEGVTDTALDTAGEVTNTIMDAVDGLFGGNKDAKKEDTTTEPEPSK